MTSRKTTSSAIALTVRPPATARPLMSSHCRKVTSLFCVNETFRLLGSQSRLKILLRCMRGSVAVGDIAVAGPVAILGQHHLRLLRGAPRARRAWANIFYGIADQRDQPGAPGHGGSHSGGQKRR